VSWNEIQKSIGGWSARNVAGVTGSLIDNSSGTKVAFYFTKQPGRDLCASCIRDLADRRRTVNR
jgi:hypothetical protein